MHRVMNFMFNQVVEGIDHLLTSCVFVREIWFHVVSWVHLEAVVPTQHEISFQDWWQRAERRVGREQRKGFNTLVMLMAWQTWKHRNRCVFRGNAQRIQMLLNDIKQEAHLWAIAGSRRLRSIL